MIINYDNNNILEVSGVVEEVPKYSHTILGECFFESKIKIKRLSDEYDVLPITISERLIDGLKQGDNIWVKGELRSYNRQDGEKSHLMLTIFAKEVKLSCADQINQINLTGYICKEPIYRTTPFGREIADVLVAVNRAYNKSDYLPCIAWGRNARFISNLSVGEKISLCGRVQSRNYQKKSADGECVTKTAYEISLSSVMLAEETEIHENNCVMAHNKQQLVSNI